MQNLAVIWSAVTVIAVILLMGYDGLILKNKQVRLMLLSWLPLFISSFIDNINGFLIYIPERSIVKYGFSLSILLQFYQFIRVIRANVREHEENMALKYELLQNRMVVMLSQIQPHFLFNTLNDIRFLYRESPDKAEKALVSFTRYLRGNMDSLNQSDLIPFGHELGHVQNYIDIEKMRFGNRLNVVCDIGHVQCFVPVLSVQPLVENAIRHGVAKKPEGGAVTVRTYEDAHDVTIEISDDGVGFDPSAIRHGEGHTGIENVCMRVRTMCGGNVQITSRIGEGTTVRMHIPKEKGQ
jgi:sensor histidine kinase YesM